MTDEDSPIIPAPSPDEDGPVTSWHCRHMKHDECITKGHMVAFHYQGATPGPHPTRCHCTCHRQKRSLKHDWTEYEDEIDLERAMSEVPPAWLVKQTQDRLGGNANDAPWFYYGEWEPTTATAKYGRVVCRRCAPDILTIAGTGTRVFCSEFTDPTTGSTVRAGKCFVCLVRYWFRVST